MPPIPSRQSYDLIDETDENIVEAKYQEAIKEKYKACSQSFIDDYLGRRKFDQELWEQTEEMVK